MSQARYIDLNDAIARVSGDNIKFVVLNGSYAYIRRKRGRNTTIWQWWTIEGHNYLMLENGWADGKVFMSEEEYYKLIEYLESNFEVRRHPVNDLDYCFPKEKA